MGIQIIQKKLIKKFMMISNLKRHLISKDWYESIKEL